MTDQPEDSNGNFKCPSCGSSHFGRDTAAAPDGGVLVLDTVSCHGDGCKWNGVWIDPIMRAKTNPISSGVTWVQFMNGDLPEDWDENSVHCRQRRQSCEFQHPLTCGNNRSDDQHVAYAKMIGGDNGQLIAVYDGWLCPVCGWKQRLDLSPVLTPMSAREVVEGLAKRMDGIPEGELWHGYVAICLRESMRPDLSLKRESLP